MVTPRVPTDLSCPMCGGVRFDEMPTRLDSRMLQGRHTATLLVCTACAYVHMFLGRR